MSAPPPRNAFQRWGRTRAGAAVLIVVVLAVVFALVGTPKVWASVPTEDNFVSVTTSRYASGAMGHTDRAAAKSLLGTKANPTRFGQEVKDAYSRFKAAHTGKAASTGMATASKADDGMGSDPTPAMLALAKDWPSPGEVLDAVGDAMKCGTFAADYHSWNDLNCKGAQAFENVVQSTAKLTVNCITVVSGGSVAVKTLTGELVTRATIRDPGGAIRVIFTKNGGAFAAGMGFCAAQHLFHVIPQIGKTAASHG